jgi:hypothetical protein
VRAAARPHPPCKHWEDYYYWETDPIHDQNECANSFQFSLFPQKPKR